MVAWLITKILLLALTLVIHYKNTAVFALNHGYKPLEISCLMKFIYF